MGRRPSAIFGPFSSLKDSFDPVFFGGSPHLGPEWGRFLAMAPKCAAGGVRRDDPGRGNPKRPLPASIDDLVSSEAHPNLHGPFRHRIRQLVEAIGSPLRLTLVPPVSRSLKGAPTGPAVVDRAKWGAWALPLDGSTGPGRLLVIGDWGSLRFSGIFSSEPPPGPPARRVFSSSCFPTSSRPPPSSGCRPPHPPHLSPPRRGAC